jgi:hypothetical protein
MPAMRWWIALLVSSVACSKDAPASSPLVGESRALVDRMCACRDTACANAVDSQWNDVAKSQPAQQLSADDIEALARETQRYAQCLAAVRK